MTQHNNSTAVKQWNATLCSAMYYSSPLSRSITKKLLMKIKQAYVRYVCACVCVCVCVLCIVICVCVSVDHLSLSDDNWISSCFILPHRPFHSFFLSFVPLSYLSFPFLSTSRWLPSVHLFFLLLVLLIFFSFIHPLLPLFLHSVFSSRLSLHYVSYFHQHHWQVSTA